MPRLIGRDGRLRIGLLLGALLATSSVLALAAFFLFPRPGATPTAQPSAASGAAEPSSSEILEGSYDPAPTGCLGGQNRDTAMVLAAQKKAGHSVFGAIEVAAAVFRWGLRYPYPSTSEVKAIRPALAPGTATKQEADLLRSYSGGYRAPLSRGIAEGTPYYVTTANGAWLVSSSSTADRVTVQLEAHPVVDGAYSTSTVNLQVGMQWTSSAWHLRGFAVADGNALANGATSFTSGC